MKETNRVHGKKGFAVVSKNFARYRFENNFWLSISKKPEIHQDLHILAK